MMVLYQPRIIRFALVGSAGFIVDTVIFAFCFYVVSLPLILSRSIAFICAASTTWFGNRCFTFQSTSNKQSSKSSLPTECEDRNGAKMLLQWLKFMGCALVSAMPNLMVFQSVALVLGSGGIKPFIALVAGILVGMFSNYFMSRRWVFNS